VWRYVLAFVQDRFLAMTVHNLGELDKRMLNTYASGAWELQVGEVVAGSMMYHHIRRAEEAVQAVAKRAVPVNHTPSAQPEYSSSKPKGKSCGLCYSRDHEYRKKAYGHPADAPITKTCNVKLADGNLCGLKHAWTGPLASPCRDGLAQFAAPRHD